MTFTTTPLIGGGTLVEGTDSAGKDGSVILRSELWDQVVAYRAKARAQVGFDAALKEFFKPLTDATDAFRASAEDDEDSVVVLDEGTAHVQGEEPKRIHLDPDGIVLKLLSEHRHASLRWIANGTALVATRV